MRTFAPLLTVLFCGSGLQAAEAPRKGVSIVGVTGYGLAKGARVPLPRPSRPASATWPKRSGGPAVFASRLGGRRPITALILTLGARVQSGAAVFGTDRSLGRCCAFSPSLSCRGLPSPSSPSKPISRSDCGASRGRGSEGWAPPSCGPNWCRSWPNEGGRPLGGVRPAAVHQSGPLLAVAVAGEERQNSTAASRRRTPE
jgi:hypothetical protein